MSEEKIVHHIAYAKKRSDIPEFDQAMKCPKCGGPTEEGFGMAGGGYGVYTFCPSCQRILSKSEEME